MSEKASLTISLPREDIDRLGSLAAQTGRSVDALASDAVATFLSNEDWQVAAIREAVEEADAGAVPVDHARVVAWLESWGTGDELPRPR